jgi:hypothetical protein
MKSQTQIKFHKNTNYGVTGNIEDRPNCVVLSAKKRLNTVAVRFACFGKVYNGRFLCQNQDEVSEIYTGYNFDISDERLTSYTPEKS